MRDSMPMLSRKQGDTHTHTQHIKFAAQGRGPRSGPVARATKGSDDRHRSGRPPPFCFSGREEISRRLLVRQAPLGRQARAGCRTCRLVRQLCATSMALGRMGKANSQASQV